MRLFWSGVPVSSRRRWDLKCSRVCQRWDRKFLMFCASSRTRYTQFLRRNAMWSCMTSVYDVMHTWKASFLDQPCRFCRRSALEP